MSILNGYTDIYEAVDNELTTEELIELLEERELSLENLWSLSNMISLSLEYEHLKED